MVITMIRMLTGIMKMLQIRMKIMVTIPILMMKTKWILIIQIKQNDRNNNTRPHASYRQTTTESSTTVLKSSQIPHRIPENPDTFP